MKFIRDRRGVAAIEFAIPAPLAIAMCGYGVDVAQHMALKAKTAFTIQGAAMAGQSHLQTIVAANAILFLPGWSYTATTTANGNNTFTATLNSTEPALWPMFNSTVTASATVTMANPP
jgi:Flp pilus assembly protein TadG